MSTTAAPRLAISGAMLRIKAHGADIVDQYRPCIQRCGCHTGAVRIDGHQSPVPFDELPNHRHHTCLLHFWWDRERSRARRLSANVDDISAGGQHGFGVLERLLRLEIQPTVRERIRRHVQNAHDIRALPEIPHLLPQDELRRPVLLQLQGLCQRRHNALKQWVLLLPQLVHERGRATTQQITLAASAPAVLYPQ